jgi:hypothetical protein
LFLLKEHSQRVADIQDTERFRIVAEDRHVLDAVFHHDLPCGLQFVARAAGYDVATNQRMRSDLLSTPAALPPSSLTTANPIPGLESVRAAACSVAATSINISRRHGIEFFNAHGFLLTALVGTAGYLGVG